MKKAQGKKNGAAEASAHGRECGAGTAAAIGAVMADLEAIVDVCLAAQECDGPEGGLFRMIARVLDGDLDMLEAAARR